MDLEKGEARRRGCLALGVPTAGWGTPHRKDVVTPAPRPISELIPVIEDRAGDGALIRTVNARDLHAFLEAGKDFSNWIKDRIEQFGFSENSDFLLTELGEQDSVNSHGGHNRVDYHLTLDMAKELAMVERNAKGKEARLYFIEIEKRYRAQAAAPQAPLDLNDPAVLHGLLLSHTKQLVEAREQIEHLGQEAKAAKEDAERQKARRPQRNSGAAPATKSAEARRAMFQAQKETVGVTNGGGSPGRTINPASPLAEAGIDKKLGSDAMATCSGPISSDGT